jgi:diguanylate cyclase
MNPVLPGLQSPRPSAPAAAADGCAPVPAELRGAPRARSGWQRLADLVLSRDPKCRIRVSQTCIAVGVTLPALAVLQFAAMLGLLPPSHVAAWVMATLGGSALFYAAIRSGWSERLADPSLTVAQMMFAIGCCAAGYAIAGAARGALLPMVMVALMFGMFSLTLRQGLRVCAFATLLFGAVMWQLPRWQPGTASTAVEASHFLMLAAMMPAVSLLAARLSRMRSRLNGQKQELRQALEHIRFLAARDDLTGLANRRAVSELMVQAQALHERQGSPWCIALIDLDHFKHVNDAHGHPAGDDVLRAFAKMGLQRVRAGDTLARWGGEEFILLMPACPLANAHEVADRLRASLAGMEIRHGEAVLRVTMSAGVVGFRAGESMAQLTERADVALYQAKSQGRNRVVST